MFNEAQCIREEAEEAYQQRQYFSAITLFETYLKTHGDDAKARIDLGACFYLTRQREKALSIFDNIDSSYNQYIIQKQLEVLSLSGDIQNFNHVLKNLISQNGLNTQTRPLQLMVGFSIPYCMNEKELEEWYAHTLEQEAQWMHPDLRISSKHVFVPHYSACVTYGGNPRSYMEALHRSIRHAYQLQTFDKYATPRPIQRILFISAMLCGNHNGISRYYTGHVKGLRDAGFEVHIAKAAGSPERGNHIPGVHVWDLPRDMQGMCETILTINPDLIIYVDGLELATYALSSIRLAPIQCVLGAHPITTGKDTLDYFIGHAVWEGENSSAFYTEKLVCLDGFPIHISPTQIPSYLSTRDVWGIPEGHLYVCVQTTRKITPETLLLWIEILRQDPQGLLAYIDASHIYAGEWMNAFFQTHAPDLRGRIFALRDLKGADYLSLIHEADILLDTKFFGGGLTTFDALSLNRPVVCFEQPYVRGRITAALQRTIGMSDLIAQNDQEYIQKAIHVAQNKADREQLRKHIEAHQHLLFNQNSGVEAFVQWVSNFSE